VDEDQPFIDGPRLYRFVEREVCRPDDLLIPLDFIRNTLLFSFFFFFFF